MQERAFYGLSAAGFHRIAYTEWGDGPHTVICVHGLTRNGRDFDQLAYTLAESGYRVLCPDVVGRGRSDRLSNPDFYTYPQYLADMTALLARADVESVDWVGTSMGGLIGMLLAAQPQSPIRRLVINDVGPFVPKTALQRIGAYVGTDPVFEDVKAVEGYFQTVYQSFGQLTAQQWRHLAEHSVIERPDGRLGLAFDPGISKPLRAANLADVDLWASWDAVRAPVLVLRGAESDLLLPETAAAMCTRGPDTTLIEIPGAGHAPSLMQPKEIALIHNFLCTPHDN